jgi:hypothetical protein
MSEIPDDIREKARELVYLCVYSDSIPEQIDIVADALMAERRLCGEHFVQDFPTKELFRLVCLRMQLDLASESRPS